MTPLIIVIILLVLLVALLPNWGYTRGRSWGYYPGGGIGALLLLIIILWLLGVF